MELIISEKDAQGQNIADALNMQEKSMEISIPNKEAFEISNKMESIAIRYNSKKDELSILKDQAKDQSKKYLTTEAQTTKLLSEYSNLKKRYDAILPDLEIISIRYWENDTSILVACMGHLIDITFDKNSDEDYTDVDSFYKVKFDTCLKIPSPLNVDAKNRYARFKLIENIIKEKTIDSYICATDFDREGQSIFGTLMEYFDIDFDDCKRMKFSTLEANVLLNAYQNTIDFDIDFYNAGKMRRWMDYVIGWNISPQFSRLYTLIISEYLSELGFEKEIINALKYNSFNVGRVKLVILDYIFQHTQDQLQNCSLLEDHLPNKKEIEKFAIKFKDRKQIEVYIAEHDHEIFDDIRDKVDFANEFEVQIKDVKYQEIEKKTDDDLEIPTFLDFSKLFQICEKLGASTDQINRISEYLYLQKYISYPRSKSKRWEIDDPNDKLAYAQSVLEALDQCGYTIKDYYKNTFGHEGDEIATVLGHQCIHPLPSLTSDMVEKLKNTNSLAFLVLNEIIIYTLKCFEKLPLLKEQIITYNFKQNQIEKDMQSTFIIDILKPNILEFDGIFTTHLLQKEIDVQKGDIFKVIPQHYFKIEYELTENHQQFQKINDFDVIQYLNEKDIGTDATRSVLLKELIELQYLASENILLTTFLGNILSELASNFIEFIDEDYTLEMESDLNEIELGNLDIKDYVKKVKAVIIETCENINQNIKEIKDIFIDNLPVCEEHDVKMLIKTGKFGKFLQCPYFYDQNEKCDQKLSL